MSLFSNFWINYDPTFTSQFLGSFYKIRYDLVLTPAPEKASCFWSLTHLLTSTFGSYVLGRDIGSLWFLPKFCWGEISPALTSPVVSMPTNFQQHEGYSHLSLYYWFACLVHGWALYLLLFMLLQLTVYTDFSILCPDIIRFSIVWLPRPGRCLLLFLQAQIHLP